MVYGGGDTTLRQTLVALTAATAQAARGPGEATVHVLSGRVRLSAGDVARKDAHRYVHSNP